MQINSVCPHCQNRYQLARGLLGQKIRCPNPDCRQFFEVAEAPVERVKPPAKPKPARDRRAPSIDDDPTGLVAPDPEPAVSDWNAMPPPPVRRKEPSQKAPAASAAAPSADPNDVLKWMMAPAPADAAPAHEEAPVALEYGDAHAPSYDYDPYHHHGHGAKRHKWMTWAMILLILLLGGGGLGVFAFVKSKWRAREAELANAAKEALTQRQFVQASRQYDELIKAYPKSDDLKKYSFLKDHAAACEIAFNSPEPPEKRRVDLRRYLNNAETDAMFDNDRKKEIYEVLLRILQDQTADAEKKLKEGKFAEARKSYSEIGPARTMVEEYKIGVTQGVPDDLTGRIAKLGKDIDADEKYANFVARGKGLLDPKTLTPTGLSEYERDAIALEYISRAEVAKVLVDAKAELRKRIVFKDDPKDPEPLPTGGELPSLLVGASSGKAGPDERAVFALARGVLFALAESDLRILWATRVSVDMNALPVRIPKLNARTPEVVLVPTADGKGLLARESVTGKPKWFQRLTAQVQGKAEPTAMRGKPLLVERNVFVPLSDDDGTVLLLDGDDGKQQGSMTMLKRLGPGGAVQEGSGLIFLPSDSQNVFVLNPSPVSQDFPDGTLRKVALKSVLLTNHGPGTLRGEPVLVGNPDDPTGAGLLILCQSDGLDAMKVRAFPFQNPLNVVGEPVEERLPGWSWFAPVCDGEKVALVTDAGAFALFGLKQKDNTDKAMFQQILRLPKTPGVLSRGQVVHMEERAFWYLANGELAMMKMGYDPKTGQKLSDGWKESELPGAKALTIKLGAPLHAPQVSKDRDVLFVVTQTTSPTAWVATAIETATGKIKKQQPLGLAPQGDPLKLGELIFQLDQGGGLYQIDPKQITATPGSEWSMGGQVVLAPRSDVVGTPALLPTADAKSAYAVFATGDGKQLQIRHVVPGQAVKEIPAPRLPASMAGAPLLRGQTLIVPLTNGSLYRVVIGSGKDGEIGPDWRDPNLGETAHGHVVSLGGDDLLVTSGSRGLRAYKWPDGQTFSEKNREVLVPDRIVGEPLVIPVKDAPPRIVVADASGRVTLFDGDPPAKSLTWESRQLGWGGEVTGGPYYLDGGGDKPTRVMVVVDQKTLVSLDLDSKKALKYLSTGDGIATRPQRLGNKLILADLSGRYEAVSAEDLKTDRATYPAKALPAAPATAPVVLDAERMFAPLSDGTVLLIPTNVLTPKGD